MNAPREIELKLELDAASLQALRDGCLKSLAPNEVARESLTSVYFDTKKLSLRKKGLSLRVRRIGEQRLQTLKGSTDGGSGLFDRLEWNTEIASDDPDLSKIASSPFGSLLDTTRLRTRLRPVFTTEVDRTVWRARSGPADIEVALDEGHVVGEGKREAFAELELELKSGPRAQLFQVARSLLPNGRLRLGVLAKSERGYALLAPETAASSKADAQNLEPNISTEDAFKRIVGACVRHFRINESLLNETRGPEPLHQCRVALRRLRTALSLFGDVIADDEIAGLKERLRSLSQKLGDARDLDVFLGKLKDQQGDEIAPETKELLDRVWKDREHACDRVLAALRGKRLHGLMFDIVAWSQAGPWLINPDEAARARREQPIERFAAETLERRTRKIRKRGRNLEDLAPPARHDVRIEAKKLRYASEFFSALAVSKKDRRRHEAFSAALVALQEHLGELNDLALADNLARNAAEREKDPPAMPARSGGVGDVGSGRSKAEKGALKGATSAFREIAKAKPFWDPPREGVT